MNQRTGQGKTKTNLVERKYTIIYIPFDHFHLSMRCICHTINTNFNIGCPNFLRFCANSFNDFCHGDKRSENIGTCRECDNSSLSGNEREEITNFVADGIWILSATRSGRWRHMPVLDRAPFSRRKFLPCSYIGYCAESCHLVVVS